MLVILNLSRGSHSPDFEIIRAITPLGPTTITYMWILLTMYLLVTWHLCFPKLDKLGMSNLISIYALFAVETSSYSQR